MPVEHIVSEFFNSGLAPAAAGISTVADEIFDGATASGFRFSRLRIHASFYDKTANSGGGYFGYSLNMSESALESHFEGKPNSRFSDSFKEDGMYLEIIGVCPGDQTEGRITPEGGYISTPNWSLPEGQVMRWFVYNPGTAAISVMNIDAMMEINGVWLRD